MDGGSDLDAFGVAINNLIIIFETLETFNVPPLLFDPGVASAEVVIIAGIERQSFDDLIEIGVAGVGKIGKVTFRVKKSGFMLDPKRKFHVRPPADESKYPGPHRRCRRPAQNPPPNHPLAAII